MCRRRISILQPRKATPLVQLVLLPSRCEELSLPFLFLDFSFPLLPCSLFEVPLDLISRQICSICVVTALGVRTTRVKGESQFLAFSSNARTSLIVGTSLLYSLLLCSSKNYLYETNRSTGKIKKKLSNVSQP